jgi:hypothetical protein
VKEGIGLRDGFSCERRHRAELCPKVIAAQGGVGYLYRAGSGCECAVILSGILGND